MPSETIRETLLEARTALRRKADDESTPLRDARILREAALLAELHAAALDPRQNKEGVACLLQGIVHPRDAAVMALLVASLHEQTASAPGQAPQIAEGLRQRAAVWRILADEFPRPADEGVSSVMLWAYMARVNQGLIQLIQVAPATQQMMFIREVNMLSIENVALSMLQESTAAEMDAAERAESSHVAQEPQAAAESPPAPTTPSRLVVVSG